MRKSCPFISPCPLATIAPKRVRNAFTMSLESTPSGEAINVGQLYTLFARAIRDRAVRDSTSRQPTFGTAVDLHRLVDAIKQASDRGREVTFE